MEVHSPPERDGSESPVQAKRQRVLVVGHSAGMQIFGAERSLLDVLDGFAAIGFEVVVAIPATENDDYVAELARRCLAVRTVPFRNEWPRPRTTEADAGHIVELIRHYRVQAVHVNTVVPQEALVAARLCGIPGVVHAREIPIGDPALCDWFGFDEPQEVIDAVMANADYVIACSRAVASSFPLYNATAMVPNVIDANIFDERDPAAMTSVRVALVGSTAERKGLLEFVAVAEMLEAQGSDVECVVVGPISDLVLNLQASGSLPSNLRFVGYVPGPVAAMAQADIVVNLSICHEAFGRTLLEAMAAGLPVVAYAHGGIPEMVRDGSTGFLVTPGDRAAAAAHIARLGSDHELRRVMGAAGRALAIDRYSPAALADAFAVVYRTVLPSAAAREQSRDDIVIALPTDNRSPFLEPFYAGNRARFAQCSAVRFIGPRHLAVVSLLGRRMYVMQLELENGNGEIVFSTPTTNGAHDVSADLIDFDGRGHLVASNCEYSSVSTYRVESNRIIFEQSVACDDSATPYCHGAAFVPSRPGVIAVALTTEQPRVAFLTHDQEPIAPFINDGWLPKSVTFVGDLMVVSSVTHNNALHPRSGTQAQVALVKLGGDGVSHEVLDTLEITGTFDGSHAGGNRVYLANQSEDSVTVIEVDAGRLHRLDDLEGFSFPHDVAVSPDGKWLAIACYGGNEVRVRRLTGERQGRRRWSFPRLVRGRRAKHVSGPP